MSLAIDVNSVVAVLLADGWHRVVDKSFEIDAYEFLSEQDVVLGGGQVNGVVSTGASWEEESGHSIACPLTSVLAVRQEF